METTESGLLSTRSTAQRTQPTTGFPSSTSEDSGQATKPKINFVSIVASITNLQISFTYLSLKYYGRLILRLNQTGTTIAQILYYQQ